MAVAKRLFEKRSEQILRVLSTESVDYCLATLKTDPKEKLLIFAELRSNRSDAYDLGAHPLNSGPSIGRIRVTDDWLKHYDVTFHTYDSKPKLSGVLADTSGQEIRDGVAKLTSRDIPRFKGKHLFTDPLGRKWFMIPDSVPTECDLRDVLHFKMLCERGIRNFGGQAWFVLDHIHLYEGTWHFEHADQPAVPTEDVSGMNFLGTNHVDPSLKKMYTLEETDDPDLATVSILVKGTDLVDSVRRFKLTLHVKDLCEKGNVMDLAKLLRPILQSEFYNTQLIFNEDNLRIEHDSRGAAFALSVSRNHGDRYYNTMSTDQINWGFVTVRNPRFDRTFT